MRVRKKVKINKCSKTHIENQKNLRFKNKMKIDLFREGMNYNMRGRH